MMINTIIFDWKQTLYSPSSASLIEGTEEVLEYLNNQNVVLYLIGKGGKDMQDEIDRLNVRKHFKDVLFVESSKEPDHFKKFINSNDNSGVLIIGDKLSSEIEVGNKIGARTIQVKQGKFAADEPLNENQKPDVTVNNLAELKETLIDLLS